MSRPKWCGLLNLNYLEEDRACVDKISMNRVHDRTYGLSRVVHAQKEMSPEGKSMDVAVVSVRGTAILHILQMENNFFHPCTSLYLARRSSAS